jgi:hypothetical protein
MYDEYSETSLNAAVFRPKQLTDCRGRIVNAVLRIREVTGSISTRRPAILIEGFMVSLSTARRVSG